MLSNDQKIVEYEKYCPKCEYFLNSEDEDPCRECLDIPYNTQSHKPVYFKERDKKK